ncbi:nitrate- and nitrite sensing domain-containing protein [Streptomyces sp. URMC 123]|uniref:sensor histidine kinase n=1 Tax=Streptomyces sp. URMC 123 TaxID=3423403 RepID=UPI003F19AE84
MQGRFKRDGSGAADPEPRGGADRGSSPQRAQGPGAPPAAPAGPGPDRGAGGGAPVVGAPAPGSEPGAVTGAQGGTQGGAKAKGGSTSKGGGKAKAGGKAKGEAKTSGKSSGKSPTDAGSRIALRNWRISTRLVSLLALPVVAATTLGGLRINTSLDNLEQLDNMQLLTKMTKQATDLAEALQEERDHSAGPLAAGDDKNDDVVYSREKTNRSIQSFREATREIEQSDSAALVGANSSLVNIVKQLQKIKTIRAGAYSNSDYIAQTVSSYNELITSLLSLSQDMAQATSNSDMIRSTRALAAFSSAKEYASIQRAMVSAGLAHQPKPKLSVSDRQYGQSALVSGESALAQFIQIYAGRTESEQLLQALSDGGNAEIIAADQYALRMLTPDSQIEAEKRSYKDWYDQDTTKIEEMSRIEDTLLNEMQQKAAELRSEAQQDAILNGVVILLVLGVSLVGAFVVARSMVRSLRRLQDTAQTVAQKRLPELVKQLSESDPQDVDTSVESVGVHSRDEIGRVAAAFDDVHREAVRLAAEQALLRGNVNAMFTNLSRRSQGLIQRQLSLISELESREADPDQLSSLFKLDHLATRMRRNGENLLVLAGEEPGRRWTRPVPLVDVLRAAASEVEQYERIELSGVPATEVAGRVVNDLVHLLAELLENATSFSSPQTKVKVTGHALPDGRVLVEIHDTGIGLSPEDLAAINERLASPPTVDVSVSRRMGLFVVGRLSLRHGIRIQLRPSDSGGTTALVMLPVDVAQGGKKPAPGKPGAPAAGSGAPGAVSGAPGAPGLPGGAGGAARPGGPGAPGKSGHNPAANRLAGMKPRGQVGGSRPALPGREPGAAGRAAGMPIEGAGGPQGGPGGLPSRPGAGSPAGAGAFGGADAFGGSGSGAGQSSGGAAFGGPSGQNPQAGSGAFGGRQADPFGGQGGDRPGGSDNLPAAPRRGGALPTRGAGGGTPTVAPPTGAPGAQGGQGRGDAPARRRPQLPARGTAGELPGDGRPAGPSWGADRSGGDDWPGRAPSSAPAGNESEGPRGHEDVESTGRFPQPGVGEAAGPREHRPEAYRPAGDGAQGRGPGDTAEFSLPGLEPRRPDAGGTPQHTGEFPVGQHTGEHRVPQAGADTGAADALGGPQRTGEYDLPQRTGEYELPQQTGEYGLPQSTGEYELPQQTGEYDLPQRTGEYDLPQRTGEYDLPQQTGEYALPNGSGQDSLPPAESQGDGRTPLFEALESDWFRGVQGQPGEQPAGPAAPAPSRENAEASLPAEEPRAPMPRRDPGATVRSEGDTGANWRTSPNDERWRRAEQLREPKAGGITTSGLPRRVPRANLVAGTAQQQTPQTGPQVSRAPDDVRGRLTNLRRGIQQGRQAGTDGRGIGPTYQQER